MRRFRAELLSAKMKERGITQAKLAKALAHSRSLISHWLGGMAQPSGGDVRFLSQVFKVKLADWYTIEPPETHVTKADVEEIKAALKRLEDSMQTIMKLGLSRSQLEAQGKPPVEAEIPPDAEPVEPVDDKQAK
jgi:transcriptional regulator with XRE-family HTH domain